MKISTRMISLILAVVLAISCLAITVFADNAIKSGIAYVNASALNMRSAPSRPEPSAPVNPTTCENNLRFGYFLVCIFEVE